MAASPAFDPSTLVLGSGLGLVAAPIVSSLVGTRGSVVIGLGVGTFAAYLWTQRPRKLVHSKVARSRSTSSMGFDMFRGDETEVDAHQDPPGSVAPALNDLISLLWPRIETYVQDMIRDSVEPSINSALPSLLAKRGGVKFTTVSLGKCAPKLGPLLVEHKQESGVIFLRIGIDISSQIDLQLSALGVPIGIRNFSLTGEMLVCFADPQMKPPFFGGLEMYFPNPPDIGIEFDGVAKVAEVPGLRGAIRGAIDNAVGNICVLPRRIGVDLNPDSDVDVVDLKYPDPVGVLRVTLWSGHNLLPADSNWFSAPNSDPYVVAAMGTTSWQSPTIKQNLNPVWGDGKGVTAEFLVHDHRQKLNLKVFDYDFGSGDDLIGCAKWLDIQELASDELSTQEVQLWADDGEKSAGSIKISASFFSLASMRPNEQPSALGVSEALLSAKIMTIEGLEDGAQFPFKIRVQVLRPSYPHDAVLAEGCTNASHPRDKKMLLQVYHTIATNLAERGRTHAEIAEILTVDEKGVDNFFKIQAGGSEDPKAAKEYQQWEMNRLSVKKPRFDEVLQLLLPCETVQKSNNVVLTILDKSSKTLATIKTPMSKVMESQDCKLVGPFQTDKEGITVEGSLCLKRVI